MDLGGFFKSGFNTDYLFAESGTYQTTQDVNEHQTELVQAQQAAGLLTDVESQAKIAELQGNTLGQVAADSGRPTDVFVSEATKNAKDIQGSTRNLLSGIVGTIPPSIWIILVVALLVYIEIETGIFTGFLKRKAAA
jgi:hypothetical protein